MNNDKTKKIIRNILLLSTIMFYCTTAHSSITMNNASHIDIDSLNEEKRMIFNTIDYFSNNYPYSIHQVENFYNHQFQLIEVAHGLNNFFEISQDTNEHPFIQDIDLRVSDINSKLLIIDFKNPICFNSSEYNKLISDYKKSYNSHFQSYYRVLDKKNDIGKVFLTNRLVIVGIKDHIRGYSSSSDQSNNSKPLKIISDLEKENNSRCITNLTFNTFDSIKPKRYGRYIRK
ncbi:hypothetical protein C8D84_10735 [Psychrobacter immobilis]|uniref:Uncharacterized protein n=1 Tax=Psychrobacter immobilis TaxID=498 RepID=A0A2V2A575_PSYIM|nr:hypothetical protein [Psychrobacter immobilis]PWK12563.1 hypothetical protein C8D84_10735 [Psychrobacter immobilis]